MFVLTLARINVAILLLRSDWRDCISQRKHGYIARIGLTEQGLSPSSLSCHPSVYEARIVLLLLCATVLRVLYTAEG